MRVCGQISWHRFPPVWTRLLAPFFLPPRRQVAQCFELHSFMPLTVSDKTVRPTTVSVSHTVLHSSTRAACLAVSSLLTALAASFISAIGLNLVQCPFLQEAFQMALPDADTLSCVLRALLLVAILSPLSLGCLSSSILDAGRNGNSTFPYIPVLIKCLLDK